MLPLPSPVGEKNIWNLPLLKELQSLCTCGNRIRSQHQHTIDMNGVKGVSTISAVMEGNTVEISLWREMRQLLEVV